MSDKQADTKHTANPKPFEETEWSYTDGGRCPGCRNGSLIRRYKKGHAGFGDYCPDCDFDGINTSDWIAEAQP